MVTGDKVERGSLLPTNKIGKSIHDSSKIHPDPFLQNSFVSARPSPPTRFLNAKAKNTPS